jgi:hypothetical protein
MKTRVYIYNEGTCPELNCDALCSELRALLPWIEPVVVRAWHQEFDVGDDAVAEAMARSKVIQDIAVTENEPLPGEITYELRQLEKGPERIVGLVYNGFLLQEKIRLLCRIRSARDVHIIATNQLLATFDEQDRRYHLRTIVLGNPSLISTTGLREAPAKPKEFYLLKRGISTLPGGQQYFDQMMQHDVAEQLRSRMLLPHDTRINAVLLGMCAQAIMYHVAGEASCPDIHCLLYNAHWQEELIRAMVENEQKFCAHHRQTIEDLSSRARPQQD